MKVKISNINNGNFSDEEILEEREKLRGRTLGRRECRTIEENEIH